MTKNKKINVQGINVVMYEDGKEDFISLTDIARHRDSVRSDYILQNWLRNRGTIEFIGLWEQFHNPNFNSIEFDGIKISAGSNSFSLTPIGGLRKRTQSELFPKRGDMEEQKKVTVITLSGICNVLFLK